MRISTKNIVLSIDDIPSSWIFEHYLKLNTGTLRGSDVKIRSPFSEDWEPSFSIFKHKSNPEGPYYWNCLSSGVKGGVIDLVARLKGVEKNVAAEIIKKDYLSGNTPEEITPQLPNTKGRVTSYELRKWTNKDYEWWKQFGITPPTLDKYNVACMGKFIMQKVKDGESLVMEFNNPTVFGYFTRTGELAKIYQPLQPKAKFIKVIESRWLQGLDQCVFKAERLLIPSSLKDIMAVDELDLGGYEFVGPDSENVLISKTDMDFLKSKYKWIGVLMDNDLPGRNSAQKYVEKYQLEDIHLDLAKDPSDAVRDFNQHVTKIKLLQLL